MGKFTFLTGNAHINPGSPNPHPFKEQTYQSSQAIIRIKSSCFVLVKNAIKLKITQLVSLLLPKGKKLANIGVVRKVTSALGSISC